MKIELEFTATVIEPLIAAHTRKVHRLPKDHPVTVKLVAGPHRVVALVEFNDPAILWAGKPKPRRARCEGSLQPVVSVVKRTDDGTLFGRCPECDGTVMAREVGDGCVRLITCAHAAP